MEKISQMKQENCQKINCLIIHYNTPELTEACVKSINKHTPGCKIYIFDNSDTRPFTAYFDNVNIIDNTKGQIINFEEWLKQFSNINEYTRKANNLGSAKHTYSIQKCMEILNCPFILMDSDILIKKDFSSLANKKYSAVGKIHKSKGKPRLLPFLCYINCFSISYFDKDRCVGFDSPDGKFWDTGASYLYDLQQNKKDILNVQNLEEYYEHLGSASWTNKNVNKWLNQYKYLYEL